MTQTTVGHTWEILEIEYFKNGNRKGDGDTLNAIRKTRMLLGDRWKWVIDDDFIPLRLAWVQVAERNDPDGPLGTSDLTEWINRKLPLGPLRVVCFGTAGWDRELVDLIAADGESASAWLMLYGNSGKGWPLYE